MMLYTIGHSTHDLDTFIGLLRQHGIACLVDVRSQPYSRWTPQFNREALARALQAEGIEYVHLGDSLGGRPQQADLYDPGSERPNYSRQRQTALYQEGVTALAGLAQERTTAIMCSEGDPDACHRTLLIAPTFIDLDYDVQHILPDGSLRRAEKPLDQLSFGF